MKDRQLRDAIATEAARLILRRKVVEFHAARIRASRWISKRKLSHQEMPTNAEIQAKIEELACLFLDEATRASDDPDSDDPDSDAPDRDEPDSDAADGDSLDDAPDHDVAADGYHPDAFALLAILMNRLDGLRLDPHEHPEGDALYHSLQVFELGRDERPWDEEFLLACLIHDVGLAIDRHKPREAAVAAIGRLVTERTRFLIEHLAEAADYLRTGRISRSLRRSEHFDDLVDLARIDQQGRVAGAEVGTLDEAFACLTDLETAWDDE